MQAIIDAGSAKDMATRVIGQRVVAALAEAEARVRKG